MTLLVQAGWAAIAASAFAIPFNVPPRAVPACALVGAAGYGFRGLCMQAHVGPLEIATFLGAALVSVLALICGKLLHAPPPIFAIPGVIPFIPGALALRSTHEVIEIATTLSEPQRTAVVLALAHDAFETGLIVVAMAVGVAVPTLLVPRRR
jgi:uncharacterized membrane protein YjjB (DUF3815 family)